LRDLAPVLMPISGFGRNRSMQNDPVSACPGSTNAKIASSRDRWFQLAPL
jgi:hypothetical protein